MKIIKTEIPDVLVIEPKVFGDDRGFFYESFNEKTWREATGIDAHFVQDNHSRSAKGVLRGLHYQLPPAAQGKLVRCVVGEVFDVAVDIRRGSPTFGRWVGTVLSDENRRQLFIPEGFAHGFCVFSDRADVVYKCSDFYYPEDDHGIQWSDPQINIDWPVRNPILSPKDAELPLLADAAATLPSYTA